MRGYTKSATAQLLAEELAQFIVNGIAEINKSERLFKIYFRAITNRMTFNIIARQPDSHRYICSAELERGQVTCNEEL